MKVREEDLLELDQPDVAAQELALRPLGAVEEKSVSPAADERRGQGALGRRGGSGRPEEDDVEIHGNASLRAQILRSQLPIEREWRLGRIARLG